MRAWWSRFRRRIKKDEPIRWWWHVLNPIDADILEGEKQSLRVRIGLTIQLEELRDQIGRLEAKIDSEGGTDGR